MIIAYGIDGDGYKFRFGVKAHGPDKLLQMPPLTKPLDWPRIQELKDKYPHEARATDVGQWCWREEREGSWMS